MKKQVNLDHGTVGRFRGNRTMIRKILECADAVDTATFKPFDYAGIERRKAEKMIAAEQKRARKAARRISNDRQA